MKAGVSMVPKPKPEKKVSIEAPKATRRMTISCIKKPESELAAS